MALLVPLLGVLAMLLVVRPGDGETPAIASSSAAGSGESSFSPAETPPVSFWKHPTNRNVMRLEEWPNGELRFWVHQLDPEDETTRRVLARQGLEIDVERMTSDFVFRFCGFGYENGLRYVDIDTNGRDATFDVVVAVGFDFFRGVEHPKYGDTRWRVSLRRIGDSTLRIDGRLIGWRGLLTFGLVRAEADLVRTVVPPDACRPSPIYPVKPVRPHDAFARIQRAKTAGTPTRR